MTDKKDYFMTVDLSYKADFKEKLTKEELEERKADNRFLVHQKYHSHPLEEYEQILADLVIKGINVGGRWWDTQTIKRYKSLKNYRNRAIKICDSCIYKRDDENRFFCSATDTCRVLQFYRSIGDLMETIKESNELDDDEWIVEDYDDLLEIPLAKKLFNRMRRWRNNRHKWKRKAILAKKSLDVALDIDVDFIQYKDD